MTGTRYTLEVQPKIPEPLAKLEDFAEDLLYSWDRNVRYLFQRLDRTLWEECGHNPKVFLRRVSQHHLDEAVQDGHFMDDYHRAVTSYQTYHASSLGAGVKKHLDSDDDLVAYFCAEFGLHESLPIYSGGLGILAGDHCKAASDLHLPFIGVGMLYRQGYFTQTIDNQGKQVAHNLRTEFSDLPIKPATNHEGAEVHVHVDMPGRQVTLKVWQAKAGHIKLYLLDSDLPENEEADRRITHQLYGGDIDTRIQQEIVLGIGGVRAVRALGLKPTVWHINEGHAAFQILERCREHVANGLDFETALELVAGGTVFTTHTPVPAGHDIFDHEHIESYFSQYIAELGISKERFLELGTSTSGEGTFNQTSLSLKGARHRNGVSRIHGGVASQMEQYVWPEILPAENPVGHVTNGVHVHTFLAPEWTTLFDTKFGSEWRNELLNEEYWSRIEEIPDQLYWSIHQSLKANLYEEIKQNLANSYHRNGCSEAQIERLTQYLNGDEDILTIGFARRFATYKRATLIFSDPERLDRLLNNPDRPMMLIFAGKAHPNDIPGQHLIQVIHDFSRRPEFEGKIILLEGYDMALGRLLVSSVDVWLNNPEFPLEASGTSGQKAGMNGVLNLSVLDGWWGEGYNGNNGWAITPHTPDFDAAYRNREESQELLQLLETQVSPLYYDRCHQGYSKGWVEKSKASMKSILPRFNSSRMVMDYVRDYYAPAKRQAIKLGADNAAPAKALAQWRDRVVQAWPNVNARRLDTPTEAVSTGAPLEIKVGVCLDELDKEDIVVECLVYTEDKQGNKSNQRSYNFIATDQVVDGETIYELRLLSDLPGLQYYNLRVYPHHRHLTHPYESGRMIWI